MGADMTNLSTTMRTYLALGLLAFPATTGIGQVAADTQTPEETGSKPTIAVGAQSREIEDPMAAHEAPHAEDTRRQPPVAHAPQPNSSVVVVEREYFEHLKRLVDAQREELRLLRAELDRLRRGVPNGERGL